MNTAEIATPILPGNTTKDENWTEVIESRSRLLDLRLGELWRYRDLVMMFVRRDFLSTYKQTILGPVWFFFTATAYIAKPS
jgi:lipopolysaccharide transport system permease protein